MSVRSHKPLKSVARSVADSFTSLMNYSVDDYVMGHLLSAARATGKDTLHVNLMTGESGPSELLVPNVANSVKFYCDDFGPLVERSGADPAVVVEATLVVSFDLSTSKPVRAAPHLMESPYVCTCRIRDDRGKVFEAELKDWWYPEIVR